MRRQILSIVYIEHGTIFWALRLVTLSVSIRLSKCINYPVTKWSSDTCACSPSKHARMWSIYTCVRCCVVHPDTRRERILTYIILQGCFVIRPSALQSRFSDECLRKIADVYIYWNCTTNFKVLHTVYYSIDTYLFRTIVSTERLK